MRVLLLTGLLLLGAPVAQGQNPPDPFAGTSVQQLKVMYLRCAEASSNAVLPRHVMAACSSAGDSLRVRAFDSDLDKMLAWWHAARAERRTSWPGPVPD